MLDAQEKQKHVLQQLLRQQLALQQSEEERVLRDAEERRKALKVAVLRCAGVLGGGFS